MPVETDECLCRSQDQHTALMMATWKGFADIVQLLVSAGADISVRGKVSSSIPRTHITIFIIM
jgi:ankyrin repeat protein